MTTPKEFFDNYATFVNGVTSDESKSFESFISRLTDLHNNGNVQIERLLTAAIGLSSESGEFAEIVKKMIFQGKPDDEATVFHMKRELGDKLWYWIQACLALKLDPIEIINENIVKLKARYPGGEFDVWKSENRKSNDL